MFGSKKESSPSNKGTSAINSLVKGTTITGNVKSKTDIRIDGTLDGDLIVSAKVVIGKSGFIKGNVSAQNIHIEGKVEGNITVAEKTHLFGEAVVDGNISTRKLIVEDGAVFNGASVMNSAAKSPILHDGQESAKQRQTAKEVQKAG